MKDARVRRPFRWRAAVVLFVIVVLALGGLVYTSEWLRWTLLAPWREAQRTKQVEALLKVKEERFKRCRDRALAEGKRWVDEMLTLGQTQVAKTGPPPSLIREAFNRCMAATMQ